MRLLEQAILQTLAWFDWQQQPLTSFECWYFLWCDQGEIISATQSDVAGALETLQARGVVKCERGFWQLSDSPSYTNERLERARWSITKRRRAERAAKLISYLPFIRAVALANTLASNSAKQESDIDLLIITSAGRLYLSRLLVTILVQLLGWRRHGSRVANRVCLSFYLSDDHLNIKDLAYEFDPYLIYWLANLYCLVDKDIFNDFLQANNWVHNYVPNRFSKPHPKLEVSYKPTWLEGLLGGFVGNMLEYGARRLQLFLIRRHKNSRLNDGSSAVVVTDSVLKFHESDQRPQLAEKFQAKQTVILDNYKI